MRVYKFSQQVIGTSLVLLLLIGCGTPPASLIPMTNTPIPPTIIPTISPSPTLEPIKRVCIMTNGEHYSNSFEHVAFDYINGPGDPLGETWFEPIFESLIKNVESDCDFILTLNLEATPLSGKYFRKSSGVNLTCQNGCQVEGEISLGALGGEPMVMAVDEKIPLPQEITDCMSKAPCGEIVHKPVLELFAEYWGLQFLVEKIRYITEFRRTLPTTHIIDVLKAKTGQDFGTDADAWTEWLKEYGQR